MDYTMGGGRGGMVDLWVPWPCKGSWPTMDGKGS
jgi:hypothetical protein